MPEPLTAAALAASTITLLTPYLAEAAKAGAKKAGEAAAGGVGKLWGKLTARLTSPAALEAVQDLERQPEDADVQAAARRQLTKALETDPAWRDEVAALVEHLDGAGVAGTQHMAQRGNDNVGVQNVGNNNQFNIHGRGQGT